MALSLRTLRLAIGRHKLLVLCVVVCVLVLGVFLYTKQSSSTKFVPDPRSGSVFSVYMYEQTANAATNLMNLQCWAGSLNMNVVEPSIRENVIFADGIFYFSSDLSGERFRDLFDLEHWNRYSQQKKYSRLISMREFLDKSSRNIIFVKLLYSGYLKCPQGVFHWMSNVAASPLNFVEKLGLSFMYPYTFLSSHGFKVVRKVCIDLLQDGRLRTQKEFNDLVFGDLRGHGNFTVVFDEWRGIRNESEDEGKLDAVDPTSNLHRLIIKDSLCTHNCVSHQPYHPISVKIPPKKLTVQKSRLTSDLDTAILKKGKMVFIPSDPVLADTVKFRANYMNNKPYIAIMMRLEGLYGGAGSKSAYAKCLKTAKTLWKQATQKYGINQTFISSDLGKYGSQSWSKSRQQMSMQFQEDIMKMAGVPRSFTETLDKNLETVTGSTGRVKMSWTQTIVGAEARCVIFLGGGNFQGLILNLHSAFYLERECFAFTDKNCSLTATLGFE